MSKPDVVCILGMGRSGTSVLTRIANLIGLYLGPEQFLLQPNDANPTGYWENSEIVELNDAILAKHRGNWHEPPTFPDGWENAPSLDELKQSARALFQNRFADSELWGWKDPRNCLTLPFWKQLQPEMRYIICLRNPVDVALSLEHLFGFSAKKSSSLWLAYVSSALSQTDGHPRLKVFYEDLLDDWLTELRRVAHFLGRPERAEQLEVQEAVKEFIERDLQHYRTSTIETVADPRITYGAKALFIAQRISGRYGRKEIDNLNDGDEQNQNVLDLAKSLEFTGERFVPSETGQIKYEHLHRYALSLPFAAGKSVLDIASGEGYGTAFLARVAQSVTGVDIDPEIVRYSTEEYCLPNLKFMVGSCNSIPLPDASVEVVTSFETIEHHDQHEEMMLEIKRVLKPGGHLIISSPNRLTYSDETHNVNPFHVKELYYAEFDQLLRRHFKHVQVYGQRLATGSFVTPLQKSTARSFKAYTGDAANLRQEIANLRSPIYFIAVCSESPFSEQETITSIYTDVNDDLFKSSETERVNMVKDLEHNLQQIGDLEREVIHAKQYQKHLEREIDAHKQHQLTLEQQIARLHRDLDAATASDRNARDYHSRLEREIDAHKQHQLTLEETITSLSEGLEAAAKREKEAREYQNTLERQVDAYKQRAGALEQDLARLRQSLEAMIESDREARVQLELYSSQITKQTVRQSEMSAQISDLEALLSRETQEARELRALLTANQDQLRQSVQMLVEGQRRAQEKKELLEAMSGLSSREPSEWRGLSSFWKQILLLRRSQRRNAFLRGTLDVPEEFNVSGSLEISGWSYSTAAPIRHVGVFLDNIPLGLMTYGEPRPEVASDGMSYAPTNCGFSGNFSLEAYPAGRRTLRVCVIDEVGNIKDFIRSIIIAEPAKDAIEAAPIVQANVSFDPNGTASLIASPELVSIGKIVGLTEITWDMGDGDDGEVYVSVNGEPETLFATGPRGSKQAPWIIAGSTYDFRLYAGTEHERLLNQVSVKGTHAQTPESREVLPGLLELSACKKALDSLAQISLDSFLTSNSTIEFPLHEDPTVSIILVLYNRAELTLQCLYSILRGGIDSYEVVIVDNASTDETSRLLRQIKGAQIIQNDANLHFLRGCNQAVTSARGQYILFLNNDAQLVAGSVPSALRTLSSSEDIGAVGGKIILPDGTLQEAGSIIWQDGSCLGYGRGDSPFDPAYMYKRDVDYCSAAFLLTRRNLLLEYGGFDEDYSPAYYEETDYCVRLWKNGKRVVYDPNAIVFHYEFASSSSHARAIDLQIKHREIFADKHKDWLRSQHVASKDTHVARSRPLQGQRRILFIDDRVPHMTLGSGFPRSNRILAELVNLGHAVTFFPATCPREEWGDVYQDIPSEVEVMLNHGWERFKEFLGKRTDYYDVILISRPHNMASFKSILAETPNLCGWARVIYDAEALFANREIGQRRLEGKELTVVEQERLIIDEVSLAKNCDGIVSVSDRESREFSKYGCERVYTLGHAVEIAPSENDFDQRKDILFVGAIHSATSPNADSMIWFAEDILPMIQERLGAEVKLIIAGMSCSEFRERFKNGFVEQLGKVDDLRPVYNRARLFVAPTRFSAGIPLKICEAAAHGLPVVTTSLSGTQLGWNHERELLLADEPQSFADACVRLYSDGALWQQLRDNMLRRVDQEFSSEAFSRQLRRIIE